MKMVVHHVKIQWSVLEKASVFQRIFRFVWSRIVSCSVGKRIGYRRLSHRSSSGPAPGEQAQVADVPTEPSVSSSGFGIESDLVTLKITSLGDCRTGKTTFLTKYAGDEQGKNLEMEGLNLMNKTLWVQGAARISLSIWDVGGGSRSKVHIPIACKDSVAVLFMFDLTSRNTLNSVIHWYSEARKWNQTAIPILVGTKFDDFIKLPPDLQWTIIAQARAYAKVMKATLFFSSATHNINVNKIFKFIMTKLFNLPWQLDRNLTLGEPIIDY